MFGRKTTTMAARLLRTVLQESTSPCLIKSSKYLHQQITFQPLLGSIRPISSAFQNCQRNNENAIISRKYSTSGPARDDKGFQVYEGRVNKLLRNVKIFSLTTSVAGLIGQPYLWYTVQDMSLLVAAPLFTVVNFFVFANPIMIHYLAKRYVNELYYNPQTKTFTATMLSFFAMKKSFSFKSEDVKVPEIPGLFAMLTAKGRPMFVDDRDFTSIEIYKRMMGFDKPLDLTYTPPDSSEKKE